MRDTCVYKMDSSTTSEEEEDVAVLEEEFITPPSTQQQQGAVQQPDQVYYPTYRRGNGEGSSMCCERRISCVFILSVTAAVIGSSTQFGYNSGVLNSPQHVIRESFNDVKFSSLEMNVAVAIFAIGGLVGAVPAGLMADLLGRKYTFLLNNVFVWIGVGLQSLAVNPEMFIAGRFIIGVNSGINTVLVPLYITEISPVKLRGAVGVLHQLATTISVLIAQILGIRTFLGRPDHEFYAWRILFAVPLVFSIVQLVLLPWCPRSPRFLFLKKNNHESALRALKRLRAVTADVNGEIQQMQIELNQQKQKMSCCEFLTVPYLQRALSISIALHLAMQLTGVLGIVYYSTTVFRDSGIDNADIATTTVGAVLVIVTIITVFLVEVAGRRTLMLYGLGGMGVFFLLFTSMFCFQEGFYNSSSSNVTAPGVLLVLSSLGVVACFSLGPGSIPWLMVPELFLQEARPFAVGIATIVNWLANFTVGLSFPYILKYLYPYGTLIFVVLCGGLWIFLYRYLPETRGKSVDQITAELKAKTRKD